MLSLTLIDDVRGGEMELGQGWGGAGEAGVELRWRFPTVHGPKRKGNVAFPLLAWLGQGLSLEPSDRERKDEREAGTCIEKHRSWNTSTVRLDFI